MEPKHPKAPQKLRRRVYGNVWNEFLSSIPIGAETFAISELFTNIENSSEKITISESKQLYVPEYDEEHNWSHLLFPSSNKYIHHLNFQTMNG